MFTFHIFISSYCRLDDSVMLLRADWSKITVGPAKQIADFIIVRSVYHRAADAWTAKVSHALDEVKDQDVTSSTKSQDGVSKVFLFTDGGRADFKCAQFVHSLFSIQEQTNVEINHIVMAPYHGHGSADAAKAQASRKLKNWFMNEHQIYHSLDTIRDSTMSTITEFSIWRRSWPALWQVAWRCRLLPILLRRQTRTHLCKFQSNC